MRACTVACACARLRARVQGCMRALRLRARLRACVRALVPACVCMCCLRAYVHLNSQKLYRNAARRVLWQFYLYRTPTAASRLHITVLYAWYRTTKQITSLQRCKIKQFFCVQRLYFIRHFRNSFRTPTQIFFFVLHSYSYTSYRQHFKTKHNQNFTTPCTHEDVNLDTFSV